MIGKKFCPNCGSDNIELVAGGITGGYMCGDCGYSASIFPERPMALKQDTSESDNQFEEMENEFDEEETIIKKSKGLAVRKAKPAKKSKAKKAGKR